MVMILFYLKWLNFLWKYFNNDNDFNSDDIDFTSENDDDINSENDV